MVAKSNYAFILFLIHTLPRQQLSFSHVAKKKNPQKLRKLHHPRKKKLFFHLFSFFLFFLQRNCIEFALNAKPVRRYIPKNPIQYKLWAFVTSPVFEYTIFAMILINTLSLAMKFYQQPELYTQFLDVLNVIFTVFFTMEFVFKLGAFRFKVMFVQYQYLNFHVLLLSSLKIVTIPNVIKD